MKALIIYDSVYGNTEKLAKAIGEAIAGDVKMIRIGEVIPSQLDSIELLIVGSPTQGGRPTKPLQEFLNGIADDSLKNMQIAVFDTRISSKWVGIFGYASNRIGEMLKKKCGNLLVPPEGFMVVNTKGPLKEGELERATNWAEEIIGFNK